MTFPLVRMRRLRRNQLLRDMVAETALTCNDFIYPMFVCPGQKLRQPVPSMPGVDRFSVDTLVEECKKVRDLGIPAVMLFGIPEKKDPLGRGAYDEKGIVPQAVRALKKAVPGLLVMCDVCLCEYTDHGHCGILDKKTVHNDATLELLAKAALAYAKAGCDMVAPSDMMDGRVIEIRETLDNEGFEDLPIMSYAAKYCSAFYGPFRDAADSSPQFGDRRSYQMDPRNVIEGMREVALDIEEGADIVMVKPAMPYLDVLTRVREEYDLPVAAYQVSGEYAMLKAAAEKGWLDHDAVMMESLYAIKRAGADMILTYFAKDAAKQLAGGK
ncbi:porphobilinogen synthase [Dethiosulfatarculus sandiegensis]|uniref:Delta-aminolevulinic acid dehydratase n=1 Tax=Dethiosulfatarculus sandiegensis TaxID=1429043 RepID=A0A0D2JCQ6_9BACT|nr:porphobilinogen synthase [Dethiosulfatarculus sandiegensis]KIX15929.1 delta-aminolevulinic acid dehydratase [Dethiosulfatarculus sandiegensis]